MAECYYCGEKFIGREDKNYKCPKCGEEPNYKCPTCENIIIKKEKYLCRKCNGFRCSICKRCLCNDLSGWKNGVYYRYDSSTNTAKIGIKASGKPQKSYVYLHNEDDKGKLVEEGYVLRDILETIIQKARKQPFPEYISLCPRNIAFSVQKKINLFFQQVTASKNKENKFKFKEVLEEIENYVRTSERTNYNVQDVKVYLEDSRRVELDKTNEATRMHLETCICLGMHSKKVQGASISPSVYSSIPNSIGHCKYLKESDGTFSCINETNFIKSKRESGRFYKLRKGVDVNA